MMLFNIKFGTMKLGENLSNFGEISIPQPRQLITHPAETHSRNFDGDTEEDEDDNYNYDNQPLFPIVSQVTSSPPPAAKPNE